jgi:hypothetical protein
MIPKFDKSGNLPEGVHKAPLDEIKKTFGTSSARRKWLFDKLEEIIKLAKSTKKLERVIIWAALFQKKNTRRI